MLSSLPKEEQKIVKASYTDGGLFSLMVGSGETYIAAFTLALGNTELMAGMITTFPLLFGSTLQLFSRFLYPKFPTRRSWVVMCALLQAAAFIGMALLAFRGRSGLAGLFFFASIYWAAGYAAGPIWNVWITNIIPKSFHVEFFAIRARVLQIFTLVGVVLSGYLLHHSNFAKDNLLLIFAGLFMFASLCRILSAFMLNTHADGVRKTSDEKKLGVSWKSLSTWLKQPNIRVVILFVFLVNITVYTAAPYFTPFMLRQLNLDYDSYMILISAAFVSRIFSNSLVLKIVDKWGVKTLLSIGVFFVVPAPLLWTFSHHFLYLLCVQVVGGFAWGCYELGITILLVQQHNESDRSKLLTATNFINSIGILLGGMIGGHIIRTGGVSMESYHHVFTLSSCLRVVPLLFLPHILAGKFVPMQFSLRILGVRPATGAITRPILYSHNEKEEKKDESKV